MSIFIGFDDIPHFGFTFRTIVAYTSQGIIGMHLDAQIGSCIDKLDEQRKLIASVVIDMTTHNLFFVLFQEFYDGLSSQTTFCHYGLITRHARDFPAFADIMQFCLDSFVWRNFFSTPNQRLQEWIKLNRIQHIH